MVPRGFQELIKMNISKSKEKTAEMQQKSPKTTEPPFFSLSNVSGQWKKCLSFVEEKNKFQWMLNIRGYCDREKIVVNLGCHF